MNTASPSEAVKAPFPGLRAFEAHESLLFFGREVQVEELLDRLGENHFVAVIGTSGSGKSSLVKAGLGPALHRGYLLDATTRWRLATMRPGGSPIENMAAALGPVLNIESSADLTRSLRTTSNGLVTAVASARLARDENLLIIADQFEELFRYDVSIEQQTDAALFVSQLLEATEQRTIPIYVVVTMRSEFLGRCSEFTGLAEAFNRSQFLVPRLTRDERHQAIERPLRLVAAIPTPALVQQVLNDAGDNPDQLPVLQHALLRTFDAWKRDGATGRVEHHHYNTIGGIENALDGHGNEILANLSESARKVTERIFRSLTVTQGGVALRRPRRIEQLYQIAGVSGSAAEREVDEVVAAFAGKGNSFLMLSSTPATPATVVDITHESLIRRWKQLATWVSEEARSADWYADLSRDVIRYRGGEVGLWEDPQLSGVQRRLHEERWNETWANQYRREQDPPYPEILEFLEKSSAVQACRLKEEQDRRDRELRQAQALARSKRNLAGALVVLVVVVAVVAYQQFAMRRVLSDYRLENEKVKALAAEVLVKTRESDQFQSNARQLEEDRGKLADRLALAANTSPEEKEKLLRQIADTTKQIEDTRAREKASQGELAKLRENQALSDSDRGGLLRQIDELQKRLTSAMTERDTLRQDLKVAQSRPSGAGSAAGELAALQSKYDKERDLWTNENATLRKQLDAAGTQPPGPAGSKTDMEKKFGEGVKQYELNNPSGASQQIRDVIKMLPTQITRSGNRQLPFAPYSYLAVILYETKKGCSDLLPVLKQAEREPQVDDINAKLQSARSLCGVK